jgi:CsoR family transcriptional regulator, copper-sensing transcriptional repressor
MGVAFGDCHTHYYTHAPHRHAKGFLFPRSVVPLGKMKANNHQHPQEDREALRLRLRKIVGQLNGIDRMLADDRDCADLLTQLISARRAIKALSEKLIESHLRYCIEGASNPADGKRKLSELLTVLQRYVE